MAYTDSGNPNTTQNHSNTTFPNWRFAEKHSTHCKLLPTLPNNPYCSNFNDTVTQSNNIPRLGPSLLVNTYLLRH